MKTIIIDGSNPEDGLKALQVRISGQDEQVTELPTMDKTTFTPGPWKAIIAQPGTMLEIVNDKREYVCSLLGGDEHKQENARLIAAAPELLEVAEAYARMSDTITSKEFTVAELLALKESLVFMAPMVHAAIAKATPHPEDKDGHQ